MNGVRSRVGRTAAVAAVVGLGAVGLSGGASAQQTPPPAAVPEPAGLAPLDTNTIRRVFPAAARSSLPAVVSGARRKAVGTPVALRTTRAWDVEVFDRTIARRLGVTGVVVGLRPTTDGGGSTEVALDYSAFAQGGGGYASRLTLVRLPECALTTPDRPECQVTTPLATTNHEQKQVLTTSLAVESTVTSSLMVMAATTSTSGSSGSFGSSSVAPTGTWSVSENSGAFSWTYPIEVPDGPNGGATVPSVQLSYSSQSVDGRTAATNSQSSWVGDGWEYTPGFIERTYQPCVDTDGPRDTPDLCWAGQLITLNWGGSSTGLVYEDTTNSWRPQNDDGTRIKRYDGANNGDDNGEYWVLIDREGTRYHFGLHIAPGRTNEDVTDSAWTVPVYGPNVGDPCHAVTKCNQAWRWNLDYVQDAHGNASVYKYVKETNYYGANEQTTPVAYTRGGYLWKIWWGYRWVNTTVSSPQSVLPGTIYQTTGTNRVLFNVAERCFSDTTVCDVASMFNETNAHHWPDTPVDLNCGATGACDIHSPSFWSRKRLTEIWTEYYNTSGAATAIDRYQLTQSFPTSGEKALWLRSIQRTGYGEAGIAGTSQQLPAVTFTGALLTNRVVGYRNLPGMHRWRVNRITSETGQVVSVDYTDAECTGSPVATGASLHTNVKRCYPVYWTPPYQVTPVLDFFHKYLVSRVTVADLAGVSRNQVTSYAYVGDPAWHYDDNELVPTGKRSWGQWRGYGQVLISTGDSSSAPNGVAEQTSMVRKTFFRGMHDDYVNATTRRTRTLSHSLSSLTSDDAYYDVNEYAGWVLEEETFLTNQDGQRVSTVITNPNVIATTATRNRDSQLGPMKATILRVAQQREYSYPGSAASGNIGRWSRTIYRYDGEGDELFRSEAGTGVLGRCTVTDYKSNASTNIKVPVRERISTEQCPPTNFPTPSLVVSETQSFYDNASTDDPLAQANPTRGLLTKIRGRISTSPDKFTRTTKSYDAIGRLTLERVYTSGTSDYRQVTTAYALNTNASFAGQLTKVTKTTATVPAPSVVHTSSTTLTLGRGLPKQEVDVAGAATTADYDELGRVLRVWGPNQHTYPAAPNPPAVSGTPTVQYAYQVLHNAPESVTTTRLIYRDQSASALQTEVAISDAMGQVVQTQTQAEAGGRIVSDTIYDSQGRVVRTNGGWHTSGGVQSVLVYAPDSAIDDWTQTTYDRVGRVVAEQRRSGSTAPSASDRVDYTYSGDGTLEKVTRKGPSGAIAEITYTNVRGETTRLDQSKTGALTGAMKMTTYAYDQLGRQTGMTGPSVGGSQAVHTTAYNMAGWVTSKTDPDSGARSMTYNDAGEVLSITDPRGAGFNRSFVYDGLGRKTQELHGGLKASEWAWDNPRTGALASSTRFSPVGSTNAYVSTVGGYTKTGLPTSQTLTIPAVETGLANSYTYSNSYTPTDQPLTRGAPAVGGLPAETLATTYSKFGNPLDLVGASTYVHGTRFTAFDEPARVALREGGNAWMSFERDPQTRRLTRANLSVNSAQPQISDFTYTYDEAGNVRSSTEVIGGGGTATTQRQCYRYDSLRQLVEAWSAATCPASTTDSPVAGDITGQRRFWTSWAFDDDGGRTQQIERAVGGHVAQTITTAYTNGGLGKPFHSLTSLMQTVNGVDTNRGYSYDAAGNTATRGTPAGSQSLTWTADNLVASVTTGSQTSSYVYLADGSQVIRRDPDGTTLFLPDGEVKRTTAGVSTGTRFYQHAGVTVAVRVGSQAPKLQFADPQGTALVTVDWSSNATTRRYMDPYGNQMGATDGGAWPTSRGFLQAPVNASHGVVDVGARKYDPVIGRFLSVDPIMDPGDPAQNNGYNYAWNNPSTFSDPSGAWPNLAGLVAAAVSAVRAVVRVVSQMPVYSPAVAGIRSGSGGSPRVPFVSGARPEPAPTFSWTAAADMAHSARATSTPNGGGGGGVGVSAPNRYTSTIDAAAGLILGAKVSSAHLWAKATGGLRTVGGIAAREQARVRRKNPGVAGGSERTKAASRASKIPEWVARTDVQEGAKFLGRATPFVGAAIDVAAGKSAGEVAARGAGSYAGGSVGVAASGLCTVGAGVCAAVFVPAGSWVGYHLGGWGHALASKVDWTPWN